MKALKLCEMLVEAVPTLKGEEVPNSPALVEYGNQPLNQQSTISARCPTPMGDTRFYPKIREVWRSKLYLVPAAGLLNGTPR
ncbi:hypothetical protein K9N68_33135 [Kovacikia minuta CCNUW1]|uniref:hypothetical protein n=1 Tax=Kovacikia minuta TaxID=2931930 RepID=UPI001CCBCBA4|nr:hypothetical protein [Kovacikia minuta]UBF26294.1 hypothetical protein K9N68_33135 [Kovacikia minuta CCNUW1]